MQVNLYNEHGEWLGLTASLSSSRTEEQDLDNHIKLGNKILKDKDGEVEGWEGVKSFDITNEDNEVLYPV